MLRGAPFRTVQWSIPAPCTGRMPTDAKAASTATVCVIAMTTDCFWCMAPLNEGGVCTSCATVYEEHDPKEQTKNP
jgi:hypothetical protein